MLSPERLALPDYEYLGMLETITLLNVRYMKGHTSSALLVKWRGCQNRSAPWFSCPKVLQIDTSATCPHLHGGCSVPAARKQGRY
uniref:Centriolar satellite-associated tubulin polyglutamylase complex regulator 1 n=1 Tax=Homo sapiens TaxID=9606 RepID=E9PQS2_HUMAN